MKRIKDIHPKVKTHKCIACWEMIRDLPNIGKYIEPCKKCGGFLCPLEINEQNKAWKQDEAD